MLLTASPQDRREFLDWGLFHVEPNFLELWRRYSRALSQRNAALRASRPDREVKLWDSELSDTAGSLARLREQHIRLLVPTLETVLNRMANFRVDGLSVVSDRGWPGQLEDLATVLERDLQKDRQIGHTRCGPHRYDWELRISERAARKFCSAGQQKILICALLLAQVERVAEKGTTPVLLLDDLPAELDQAHRTLVLHQLRDYGAQVFASGTEAALLDLPDDGTTTRVFHVEQGCIKPH